MPAARFFLTRRAPGDPLLLLREDAAGYRRGTETLRDRGWAPGDRAPAAAVGALRDRGVCGGGGACLQSLPALRSHSQWLPGNHRRTCQSGGWKRVPRRRPLWTLRFLDLVSGLRCKFFNYPDSSVLFSPHFSLDVHGNDFTGRWAVEVCTAT